MCYNYFFPVCCCLFDFIYDGDFWGKGSYYFSIFKHIFFIIAYGFLLQVRKRPTLLQDWKYIYPYFLNFYVFIF